MQRAESVAALSVTHQLLLEHDDPALCFAQLVVQGDGVLNKEMMQKNRMQISDTQRKGKGRGDAARLCTPLHASARLCSGSSSSIAVRVIVLILRLPQSTSSSLQLPLHQQQ